MSTPSQALPPSRFDAEAAAWDSKPEVVRSSQAFYEALLAHEPRLTQAGANLAVLDLGCGTGLVSERLARCAGVERIVGVDASTGMISMFNAKRDRVEGGHKMQGHAKLLEDPDDAVLQGQRFDVAYMHLTLHHIEHMAATVNVVAATLRPGAGALLALSDFENDGEHAKRFHPAHKHADVERHGLTHAEMQALLVGAGLADISVTRSFSQDKTLEDGSSDAFAFVLGLGTRP